MKHYIIKPFLTVATLTCFILIQSCNNSSEERHDQSQHHEQSQDHDNHNHESISVGSHGHDGMTGDDLSLNDGEKWEADEPTNRNAEIIRTIGTHFQEIGEKTLEDYQTFGHEVNEAINTMIRECTMEGEADQALHNWFLPLLQHAETLQDATDTDGLDEIADKMIDRINMYSGYFE